jgi:chemotaxis protein methyltransferase CheR
MSITRSVEDLEITLLLEAIFQRFGSDFRHYQKSSIRQKLGDFMESHSIATISALQDRVLHGAIEVEPLLCALDARSACLFDYPEQMLKMRSICVPWLRSCPAPKIWVAECTAAEDIFGLAILLMEEDLYHKTQIYVTGPNASLLAEAREGKFSAKLFSKYEKNYFLAGGSGALADYCEKIDNLWIFNPELQDNITWAQYNLGTDASFNEFEVIVCCGGLANFTSRLRHRALHIFYSSQPTFGLLTIAGENTFESTSFVPHYKILSSKYGLYQRV